MSEESHRGYLRQIVVAPRARAVHSDCRPTLAKHSEHRKWEEQESYFRNGRRTELLIYHYRNRHCPFHAQWLRASIRKVHSVETQD